MAEELKPCPFCGVMPEIWERRRPGEWILCGTELCPAKSLYVPIAAWNTRAESPELRAIRKAMDEIMSCKRIMQATAENTGADTFYGVATGHVDAIRIIRDELAKEGVTL